MYKQQSYHAFGVFLNINQSKTILLVWKQKIMQIIAIREESFIHNSFARKCAQQYVCDGMDSIVIIRNNN